MSPATRRREITMDALGNAEPSFGLTKLRRQRFQRALLYRAQEGGQSAGESYLSSGDRRPVALGGFPSNLRLVVLEPRISRRSEREVAF